MSKQILKKPAKGWAHLYLETPGAKQALVDIGPSLAQKLSSFLGGVSVTPAVIECKSNPGCYRLLFSVPSGTKLPKGAQTLVVKAREDFTRVVTFPLEAISRNIAKIVNGFKPFMKEATLGADGKEVVVLFGDSEQVVKNLRAVATGPSLTLRELNDRKPGEPEKAICVVAQLQKPKAPAKASKPRQKTKLKSKPKQKRKTKSDNVRNIRKVPEPTSPESVRILLSSLSGQQKDFIVSAMAHMHPEEFFSMVNKSASPEIKDSLGSEPKRKGKPYGVELEKVSLN